MVRATKFVLKTVLIIVSALSFLYLGLVVFFSFFGRKYWTYEEEEEDEYI